MNYMISQGLAETGEAKLAEKLRLDLRRVIELSGFYECFNPLSGQGCIGKDFHGQRHYGWPGLDMICLRGRQARRQQMGAISLVNVEKWFGDTQVIRGLSLDISKMASWSSLLVLQGAVNQHYCG